MSDFYRPKGLSDRSHVVINQYECDCGATWTDMWDCGCDDECPACGLTVSPSESDDAPGCDCDDCEDECNIEPAESA